ncbi:hypothetical protein LJC20_01650 [Eubacteriales bacterium OttesenSCG-928-M02]|nr:hypothetical protein [Eubacteriales bacterium OttesenSCG-928-M02]
MADPFEKLKMPLSVKETEAIVAHVDLSAPVEEESRKRIEACVLKRVQEDRKERGGTTLRADTRKRPQWRSKRLWATGIAALLVIGVLFSGSYMVVEAAEYREALAFFNEYELPTEALTRGDIKKVYKDITTESYAYEKTMEVLAMVTAEGDEGSPSAMLSKEEAARLWEKHKTELQPGSEVVQSHTPEEAMKPSDVLTPWHCGAYENGKTTLTKTDGDTGAIVAKLEVAYLAEEATHFTGMSIVKGYDERGTWLTAISNTDNAVVWEKMIGTGYFSAPVILVKGNDVLVYGEERRLKEGVNGNRENPQQSVHFMEEDAYERQLVVQQIALDGSTGIARTYEMEADTKTHLGQHTLLGTDMLFVGTQQVLGNASNGKTYAIVHRFDEKGELVYTQREQWNMETIIGLHRMADGYIAWSNGEADRTTAMLHLDKDGRLVKERTYTVDGREYQVRDATWLGEGVALSAAVIRTEKKDLYQAWMDIWQRYDSKEEVVGKTGYTSRENVTHLKEKASYDAYCKEILSLVQEQQDAALLFIETDGRITVQSTTEKADAGRLRFAEGKIIQEIMQAEMVEDQWADMLAQVAREYKGGILLDGGVEGVTIPMMVKKCQLTYDEKGNILEQKDLGQDRLAYKIEKIIK